MSGPFSCNTIPLFLIVICLAIVLRKRSIIIFHLPILNHCLQAVYLQILVTSVHFPPTTFVPWTLLSAWRCLCCFPLRCADGFSDRVWVMTDFLPLFPALCQDSGRTVAHTIVSVNRGGDRHRLFADVIPIMCRRKADNLNQTRVKFHVSLSDCSAVGEDWRGTNVPRQATDH